MASLVITSVPDASKAPYEQIRKEENWEGNTHSGLLSHVAAVDGSGMRVITVWSSEQEPNNYVTTTLMPAFQKGNLAKPQQQIFRIHNMNVTPELEK